MFQGGRLIAGQVDEPFQGHLHITLRGDHSTADWPLPEGPNQGSKVLGENTKNKICEVIHKVCLLDFFLSPCVTLFNPVAAPQGCLALWSFMDNLPTFTTPNWLPPLPQDPTP